MIGLLISRNHHTYYINSKYSSMANNDGFSIEYFYFYECPIRNEDDKEYILSEIEPRLKAAGYDYDTTFAIVKKSDTDYILNIKRSIKTYTFTIKITDEGIHVAMKGKYLVTNVRTNNLVDSIHEVLKDIVESIKAEYSIKKNATPNSAANMAPQPPPLAAVANVAPPSRSSARVTPVNMVPNSSQNSCKSCVISGGRRRVKRTKHRSRKHAKKTRKGRRSARKTTHKRR